MSLCVLMLAVSIVSCEENDLNEEARIAADNVDIDSAILLINEFSPVATLENEFGEKADWVELYNTSEEDILLEEGKWSLTDNPSNIYKYNLPELVIESGSHLLLWCDGEDVYEDEVHTNFKLSSKGEYIGLYYEGKLIDGLDYDSIDSEDIFLSRVEDGADVWKKTLEASPGRGN